MGDRELFLLRLTIILGGLLSSCLTILLITIFQENQVAVDIISVIGFSIGWGLILGGILGGRH